MRAPNNPGDDFLKQGLGIQPDVSTDKQERSVNRRLGITVLAPGFLTRVTVRCKEIQKKVE